MDSSIAVRVSLLLAAAAAAPAARADHVFQFAPPIVTAPDSRSFSNSTVGSPGLLAAGTTVFSGPTLVYNFLDTWQFTLAPAADLIAFAGSINFTNSGGQVTFGIDNLQIRLAGPSGMVVGWTSATNFTGFQQLFSIISQAPFAAGQYNLQIRGLLIGPQSSYAGTLQAIQAVPLPTSLPLMAVGMALFGVLRLRAHRSDHR